MTGRFRPGGPSGGSTPPPGDGRLDRAATQGQPFEARLVDPPGFEVSDIDGLAGSGLSWNGEGIGGVPITPGTLDLLVHGVLAGRKRTLRVRLPVSPDPWSLWKDLPVDPTLPLPKPDVAAERLDGDLTLLMASRRGRSHAHKGLPRDDDAAILIDCESGWHVGAVADGAGSAALSREGSRLAVAAVMDVLPPLLADGVSPLLDTGADPRTALGEATLSAASAAVARTEEVAASQDEPPEAFATTLIIGAARRVNDEWLLATFSVGDGLAAVIAEGAEPLLMRPDTGAYAGQTMFLNARALQGAGLEGRLHVSRVRAFEAFVLMTDGVSDPMFASDAEAKDSAAWRRFWRQISPLAPGSKGAEDRLLEWLNFKVRGEHDDRSIVLMVPGEQ